MLTGSLRALSRRTCGGRLGSGDGCCRFRLDASGAGGLLVLRPSSPTEIGDPPNQITASTLRAVRADIRQKDCSLLPGASYGPRSRSGTLGGAICKAARNSSKTNQARKRGAGLGKCAPLARAQQVVGSIQNARRFVYVIRV